MKVGNKRLAAQSLKITLYNINNDNQDRGGKGERRRSAVPEGYRQNLQRRGIKLKSACLAQNDDLRHAAQPQRLARFIEAKFGELQGLELLKLARLISWGLIAAIVALSIAPVDLRPVTEAPHRIEHLAAFYPAGLALALGYNIKRWLLSLILAAFCAVIEMMQLLVPGRHARLEDFIVDVMAMWAGLITAMLAKSILGRA